MAFLEMVDIHKRFGGVVALSGASLSCERGEVHALIGANGSGKSTLNKTLTGVVAADRGEVRLRGQKVRITRPADAHRERIAAVFQELSLIPRLSVAENIVLPRQPANRFGFIDDRALIKRAHEVADLFESALGRPIPLHELVANLSPGEQQLVEILKALVREPEVLVLDEATASLHKAEVEALFAVVKALRDRGVLVVFISHRMDEIYELCDRATVLRNGKHVGTVHLQQKSRAELVRMMVGDELKNAMIRQPAKRSDTEVVLRVEGLSTKRLRDISFELHAGEVLGLGGLQGQGQSEVLTALFGAQPLSAGSIEVGGRRVRLRRPAHAVRERIAYVPGNRAREGLFLKRPIFENLTYTSMSQRASWAGLLGPRRESNAATEMVKRLQVKIGSLTDPVRTLSGGNQQKIVVGKWLLNEPRVILMDDPTKGVDVGAKAELYEVIDALTREGVAVILNSSDNTELLGLSDRVMVLFEGKAVEMLQGEGLTERELVTASLHVSESA